jgi:hypothetical protein
MVIVAVLAFIVMVGLHPSALSHVKGKASQWIWSISTPQTTGLVFDYQEIDNIAGDVKLVGDIDGDGYLDLVIGGKPSEGLNWYRYPDWEKTSVAVPSVQFTTDGALGDIDGDGDLDIIVPDGDAGDNLHWFENPLPSGDPSVGNEWLRHAIGSIRGWGKDVHVSDFDSNGWLDVATRNGSKAMIFFQSDGNNWTRMTFSGLNIGSEGMATGDLDGDSDADLVLMGVWLRNPGGVAAQTPSNWSTHTIGTASPTFKALIVDLNQDGKTDVLFSSSEGVADVSWWTPSGADPTGPWTEHTIVKSLEKAHTLQAADMDLDGDLDVVLGQMHTSTAKEIMIMFNSDSQALTWEKQVVDNNGIHNGVVADIGNDGDYDIYGANWTGNPPVKLWVNRLDEVGSFDRWTYKQITDQHLQTFGLAFGDVNGDDHTDILSGVFWYANPGGDLMGNWVQSPFPSGMHVFLVTDVDMDQFADVIAQKDEGDIALYWLEAEDKTGTTWSSVFIGSIDRASHGLGAQGYRQAQVEAGGKSEILISSGNGIYYFRVPDSPEGGNWPKVHVSANPSDEGFATGDIDRDGLLDIAATTGNSKRVEWYKNPGDGSSSWTAYHIGDFNEATFPDRTELADLNSDNRLDIIVTEENGKVSDAQTYWWEQPIDPTVGSWVRRLIVDQGTTNSMDVADMDADGDIDVILAEHRGEKKLAIWENDGLGNLIEHIVDIGKESHLGAQVVDIDNDGDLDIVSIAWDEYQFIHLWRNDSSVQEPAGEIREFLPLLLKTSSLALSRQKETGCE